MDAGKPEDAYGRIQYRRLIDWPARLRREAPFLERVLGTAPLKTVLDLGCGAGEHSRFLRSAGFEVTGIDASEDQIRMALAEDSNKEQERQDGAARYLQGDLSAIGALVSASYGGAVCLGNTLPHLREISALQRFFAGLASRLVPGAPLLLQLLNYDRILGAGERTFPLTLRPDGTEGEAILFLRLMTPGADGSVLFTPATLRYHPGKEPPLELLSAENVRLRGWRRAELEGFLRGAGFEIREVLGNMTGAPWSPEASDLVLWAVKTP